MSKPQQKNTAPAATKAPEAKSLDAKTRRLVEKSIVRLNGLVAEAGERNDAIADHVFETFYGGDVQKALNPNKDAPDAFTSLADEADGNLHMSRTQLFHAVRVGALNRRLAKTAWTSLGWTVKTELLRALGPDQSFERVSEGASFASMQKASVRDVRAWVDEQLTAGAVPEEGGEEQPKEPAKKGGPTFLAARKAVEVTATLSRGELRLAWVHRVLKLQPDDRATVRAAVKAAARNLEKLTTELEAALDGA
ncbi:MAG: hypothetical protein RL199_1134 [Pseudomonadota bacterium]|jgi:hypothetical protein